MSDKYTIGIHAVLFAQSILANLEKDLPTSNYSSHEKEQIQKDILLISNINVKSFGKNIMQQLQEKQVKIH